MLALIVREPWDSLILSGQKTWEIRTKNTNVRGRIGIIRSKSGKIMGYAELVDSMPLSKEKLLANLGKHQITKKDVSELFAPGSKYKKPWAWVLRNAKSLKTPRPYKHPNGAIIWVRI